MVRPNLVPLLSELESDADSAAAKLKDFAMSVMLDVMDHTNFYYTLMRSPVLIESLIKSGISDPRLKLMLITHNALETFECRECNNTSFNFECPVLVCDKCTSEYIIVSKVSKDTCELCPAHDLGTCTQEALMDIEFERNDRLREDKDEYNFVIIEGETTTIQESPGNLERYTNEPLESEEGELDRV